MEIFTHINELGLDGWGSLRTLVLGYARVILWGPSASYLAESRGADPTLPTAEELLWYVENHYIQVIARSWWLRNEDRRKCHRWDHSKIWTEFDDSLLGMWQDDQRAGRTPRVIAVDDEVGWDWAKDQVQTGAINIERLHKQAASLLPGYREKAASQTSERDAALSLLRDAKNHGDAFRFSGADRNLGLPTDQTLAKVILNSTTAAEMTAIPYIRTMPDVNSLMMAVNSVLEKLGRANPATVSSEGIFERTRSLLADPVELANIREWVSSCDLLASRLREEDLPGEIAGRLANTIQKHFPRVQLRDYFLPRSPFQKIAAIGGIGLAVAGIAIGNTLAPISLSLTALRPAETMLKRLSWLPADYTGERWMLYFIDGTNKSLRKNLEAILSALRDDR